MIAVHQSLLGLMLITASFAVPEAPEGWPRDPLELISKFVEWFDTLNVRFDKVVVEEKRSQLIREVDRMRKDLYSIEADSRILQDNIPEKLATAEQREDLLILIHELMNSVSTLGEHARAMGADLRLEAAEVEEVLTSGLRTRARALNYLERAVNRPDQWSPKDVHARLDEGIKGVSAAQKAVTDFRRRLDKKQ